jgi:uncharacterized protein (DUF488 family)
MSDKVIYTIGHSTHTIEHFLAMLKSFHIEILADIRSFPSSRRYPHFNQKDLQRALEEQDIKYVHIKALGGRRRTLKDSVNKVWRNEAFRGYADYMMTPEFEVGIQELEALADGQVLAYMCSEAVWWRCHRSMVSDYLKAAGWTVMHIMDTGKSEEHPFTAPAQIVDGKLTYVQAEK